GQGGLSESQAGGSAALDGSSGQGGRALRRALSAERITAARQHSERTGRDGNGHPPLRPPRRTSPQSPGQAGSPARDARPAVDGPGAGRQGGGSQGSRRQGKETRRDHRSSALSAAHRQE